MCANVTSRSLTTPGRRARLRRRLAANLSLARRLTLAPHINSGGLSVEGSSTCGSVDWYLTHKRVSKTSHLVPASREKEKNEENCCATTLAFKYTDATNKTSGIWFWVPEQASKNSSVFKLNLKCVLLGMVWPHVGAQWLAWSTRARAV